MNAKRLRAQIMLKQSEIDDAVEVVAGKISALASRRDALIAQIQPLEAELRVVGKQISAIEKEHFSQLQAEITALKAQLKSDA